MDEEHGQARGAAVRRARRRSELISVAVWWAALTTVLWLSAAALGHRTTLGGCAASALVFVAVGEAGDRLRRRCAGRTARKGAPDRG